jgi:hypothetical protein
VSASNSERSETPSQAEEAKYLGLHLDRRLNWKKYILTKRKQLGLQLEKMYWLLGSKSELSAENKLPSCLYKLFMQFPNLWRPIVGHGFQCRNITKIPK